MNIPPMPPCGRIRPTPLSRREMLSASGSGLGLWALAGLFGSHTAQIAAAAGSARDDRALAATQTLHALREQRHQEHAACDRQDRVAQTGKQATAQEASVRPVRRRFRRKHLAPNK